MPYKGKISGNGRDDFLEVFRDIYKKLKVGDMITIGGGKYTIDDLSYKPGSGDPDYSDIEEEFGPLGPTISLRNTNGRVFFWADVFYDIMRDEPDWKLEFEKS